MSPEERELLKRSIALAEENNDILRSIQRSMRLARFMSLLYWIFIIGSAVGAYYLIQPYIDTLVSVSGGAKTQLDSLNGILDTLKQAP
jgi:hypothetical protein